MAHRTRKNRRPNEFYETPGWVTQGMVDLLHLTCESGDPLAWTVLEPCSGDGAITRVLEDAGCSVESNDIDPARSARYHIDARTPELWAMIEPPDWVVTNPPFSMGYQIVRRALESARVGVAFFLRTSWIEPTSDKAWLLKSRWPDFIISVPRFSWDDDGGTDAINCCWFIWYRDPEEERRLGLRPFGGTVLDSPPPGVRRRVQTARPADTTRQEALDMDMKI